MTRTIGRLTAAALAALLLSGGRLPAADAEPAKRPARELASFGALETARPDATRAQAQDWLKAAGKADTLRKEFDAVWASDRPLLDKLADTFALGDPEAARLLKEARDAAAPAPVAVPALFTDARRPVFFRANLALAYGRDLASRRVYEEALGALKATRPEQVVDPAAYLFTRAVAEYALMKKDDANRSILRLLDDVTDAPERYRMVASLMHFDMVSWRDKDLDWVARMMKNIERRLDLTRGGPVTQDMQKKVVLQLDDMIKKLEEMQKQANGPGSGKGRRPAGNTNRPNGPASDDYITNVGGPGNVDRKRLHEIAENWGKMPDKERAEAMLQLTRNMPPRHRELIENYFKNLAKSESAAQK
jgi:hypothetical protein